MIYLYDNAIVEDLESSFNSNADCPVVRVISPEQILGVAAQIKEDQITFPIIALERSDSIEIDRELSNFTKLHRGVPAVFDKKENNMYNERAIPINLSYTLTVLTTNQADMDEIIRELMFKYLSMYFLKVKIPYESKREIAFGVILDQSSGISRKSGSSEYTDSGQLYQSSIILQCEGCVLIHYTPHHLRRGVVQIEAE